LNLLILAPKASRGTVVPAVVRRRPGGRAGSVAVSSEGGV